MAELSDNALPVGSRVGDYSIKGVINRGGFGIAYAAFHEFLAKECLLKEFFVAGHSRRDGERVIHPPEIDGYPIAEMRAQFENEARLLATIDHPNIVRCQQLIAANDTAYIAFDFVDGPNLATWLNARHEPPHERDLYRVIGPILDAVEYLHGRGIIHADINPKNILVSGNGPVLIDFGAYRRNAAATQRLPSAFATPASAQVHESFAPPEQFKPASATGDLPTLDIYALAAVLYDAAAGHPPARSNWRAEVVGGGRRDPFIPLSGAAIDPSLYGRRFLAGVDAALQLDPRDRPADIAAFRQALGWFQRSRVAASAAPAPSLVPLTEAELLRMHPKPRARSGKSAVAYHYEDPGAVTRSAATAGRAATTVLVSQRAAPEQPRPPVPPTRLVARQDSTDRRDTAPFRRNSTVSSESRRDSAMLATSSREVPMPSAAPAARGNGKAVAIGASAVVLAALAGYFLRHEIAALIGGLWKFFGATAPPPAVPARPTESDVDVSLFAPKSACRGAEFLVQVFFHDVDANQADIAALAGETDAAAVRRGLTTLDVPLALGQRIDIAVDAGDLIVEEPVQSLVWRGRSRSCVFSIRVPEKFAPASANIRIRVLRDAIPIGSIRFAMAIADELERMALAPVGSAASRFNRVFLSYSSHDRAEVLKRAQALRAAGLDFFQDVLSLEPGERWAKSLYSEIDRCDLFLLFWSAAARESEWVLREVQYAMDRRAKSGGAPEIMPVILEGPPPPVPPPELSDLHFDDQICYMIAAVEYSRGAGQAPRPEQGAGR